MMDRNELIWWRGKGSLRAGSLRGGLGVGHGKELAEHQDCASQASTLCSQVFDLLGGTCHLHICP